MQLIHASDGVKSKFLVINFYLGAEMEGFFRIIRSEEHLPYSGEQGFTMVELLISSAIVGILAAIGLSSFMIYKDDAEYSKADSDLRNARTAAELGLQEAEKTGSTFGLEFSGTTGTPLAGNLATMLPGATVTRDVQLGASLDPCISSTGSAVSQQIIARACKAERYTSWLRQCDGTEVFLQNVNLGSGC